MSHNSILSAAKTAFIALYAIVLFGFSTEIIVRRWVLSQIPLDAPVWVVALVLLANGLTLWWLVNHLTVKVVSARKTRTERN